MASTINASTTSTTGLVYTADGTGILQLQSDGTTGLTVGAGGNVTVNTNLFVSGSDVEPLVLGTAQATTSGTVINFTGIPTCSSWCKRKLYYQRLFFCGFWICFYSQLCRLQFYCRFYFSRRNGCICSC